MNDRFLSLFFEEARELLQALEAGLVDLEARREDREHLDRTFRAAHTLKGAAGMVGLRPISEFTHKVEAVLDRIRSGRLAVTPEAITALLKAKDHLAESLALAVGGNPVGEPPAAVVATLEALAQGRPVAAASTTEPAASPEEPPKPEPPKPEPPKPEPEPATAPTPVDHREQTYRIAFTPGPDLLRHGINPLGFLDELRELGTIRVAAQTERVPPLEALDPQTCYLSWTVDLTTAADRSEIDEVFLFLDDPGQVAIGLADEVSTAPAIPASASASASAVGSASASGLGSTTGGASAPPSPSARPTPLPPPPSRVRVDADQLDQLVGMAGELAVLTDSLQGLSDIPGTRPFAATLESLERLGRRLRDTTLNLRMVPIEELFVRFPRVVRDLADRTGKKIDLKIEGEETQLDRAIVERLADPMVHLIRNAVDHGLEPPEQRLAEGKPATGRITISAGHEGDRVAIRIADDGRGLDRVKILRKGVALGMLPAETSPDDPRVGNLIFEAGFSTRDQAGELSGRGVGLDVVRDTIRALRGTVSLRSVEGLGTTFLIRLPLTLAMIDGLLVESDGERYVVPIGQVDECVSLSADELTSTMGRRAAVVRGELVPIVSLRRVFGEAAEAADGRAVGSRRELLLTRYAEQRVGVDVDRLLGRVQAVIQPLDEGLGRRLGRYSGATILGDGSVSLILDLTTLVADAHLEDRRAATAGVAALGLAARESADLEPDTLAGLTALRSPR